MPVAQFVSTYKIDKDRDSLLGSWCGRNVSWVVSEDSDYAYADHDDNCRAESKHKTSDVTGDQREEHTNSQSLGKKRFQNKLRSQTGDTEWHPVSFLCSKKANLLGPKNLGSTVGPKRSTTFQSVHKHDSTTVFENSIHTCSSWEA